MPPGSLKNSYTVPCSSAFRQEVEALAARRKVNVGDLARSVLLVLPEATIAAFPDPGEPPSNDRETVILKSGPAQGRPWRRKPRLQVRMPPGYAMPLIRRALSLALAMDKGEMTVFVGDARPAVAVPPPPGDDSLFLAAAEEEVERLRAVVGVLAFQPLPDGIKTRTEALHVLGFPPGSDPDLRAIKAKFRMLATIHHPDSPYGNHARMSQLNQAMDFLPGGRGS